MCCMFCLALGPCHVQPGFVQHALPLLVVACIWVCIAFACFSVVLPLVSWRLSGFADRPLACRCNMWPWCPFGSSAVFHCSDYPFSASSPVSPFGSCLLSDMVTCALSLLCNAKRAWRPCALPALLAVTDTVAALVFQNLLWRCGCRGELRGVRRAAVPAWPMPNLTHTEAFCLGLSLLRVPARAELLRSSVVPGVRGGVAARTHQCNPSSSC
jgi:hypothetical protein